MENKHKDMRQMRVWLKPEEKLKILDSLSSDNPIDKEEIIDVMIEANERGDIKW